MRRRYRAGHNNYHNHATISTELWVYFSFHVNQLFAFLLMGVRMEVCVFDQVYVRVKPIGLDEDVKNVCQFICIIE